MRKVLKKVLVIFFVLILGYQQFSYADVITIEPIDEFRPIAFLIGFIGVIILVISAISFFTLKSTINKPNNLKIDSLNNEKIEEKKDKIQRRLYLWGIILSIVALIYLWLSEEISILTLYIPIILFAISFAIRLLPNKKVSNILCGITVGLVCIIVIWNVVSNKIIKDYNKQFLQYQKSENIYRYSQKYVSDVEGLINTAIQNNKSGRKVTFIYENTNYISVDELKQLLSKLNTNKNYLMVTKYDENYDYIESITLSTYVSPFFSDIVEYEGLEVRGSSVKSLIYTVRTSIICNLDEEIEIAITYYSDTNQKTIFNITTDNYDDVKNLISEIISEIETDKTYKVEIQNSYNVCNIIIKSNN